MLFIDFFVLTYPMRHKISNKMLLLEMIKVLFGQIINYLACGYLYAKEVTSLSYLSGDVFVDVYNILGNTFLYET
jgi:hypothetical protein